MTARSRRTTGWIVAAAAAAFIMAGCANAEDPAEADGAADTTAGAGDTGSDSPEQFPVSIDSALGTAVIESPPERVVTIGWGPEDLVFALGVVPVGVEHDEWSGDEDGYRPWFREAVEEAGHELPETFMATPEIDMDAIVALEPDVIIAPNSGLTQSDFDVLNELAPTVAYPERAWATPWDTQIELIAEALGKSDQAPVLIDEITAYFTEAAAAHPEFEDVTFAYIYAVQPGLLHLYQRHDPRVEFLTRLGLQEVPELAEMELSEGQFTTDLGLEQADLLDDADIIVTWFNDDANQAEIEAQPLYARIPAVERGTYVPINDHHLAAASSLMTPLTVPWVLDDYLELISDAVDQLD
ncbi:iron-siderophore ABC transporter substrate-binding protein [Phytoactinopolyspora mesophila]|uniref:ABC transporter substrate-binding protein n=1 Tax=Phytoactinopolyspora mesophila TaxID=2650750 RepID=A0A7K3M610_9ACTN|nr:iron-siderophore ABC transporter substrate-binding protein [Phytoactinopolyspora mesophila]NDL58685.1 ABC transporter substrate-binding protein [Phytoactinopolyspora mesophila]